MRAPVALLCTALLLAGCGDGDAGPASGVPAVDGPLHVAPEDARHPAAGAAGNIVRCATWGTGGASTAEVYAEGATAESPEKALAVARSERLADIAFDGLEVARREDGRVLYVLRVDGVVKEAVVVRDGPATDGAGGPGWYVESWARCDYAELPRSFTDALGLRVWTDAAGDPVPTRRVASWAGAAHCDWQSMTFLYLGRDRHAYVRAPLPELRDFFAEEYRAHVRVPATAEGTGYRQDGRRLWLSADGRRAYVGARRDAELWPRTVRPLGCA